MNPKIVLAAALLLIVGPSTGSWAAESRPSQVAQLTEAKKRLWASANNLKGFPRALRDMQRTKLVELLDDLEAGRPVDPKEIDHALERANELTR